MKFTLIFHPHIEDDINEAYNWYEDKQEGTGELFLSDIEIAYKNGLH